MKNKLKNIFTYVLWLLAWPFVGLSLLLNVTRVKKRRKKYFKEPHLYPEEDRYLYVNKIIKKILFLKKIKTTFINEEFIPKKPCLYVINHKSNLDSVIIIRTLMKQPGASYFSIIAKSELKKHKRISAVMELIDSIFLNRDDLRSAYECYESQKKAIAEGKSIVLFIEGHRYYQDQFGEFKPTALKIAFQTFLTIVPIVIYGSSGLMDKDKSNLKKDKHVYIKILEPIKPSSFITASQEYLCEQLQKTMQNEYMELKKNDNKN